MFSGKEGKATIFSFGEGKKDKSGCIVLLGFWGIKQIKSAGMH